MPRYKVTLEFDGAGFVGWQRQANGLAVQQVVEQAIAAFSGETVTVQGAGRTDSGVHVLGLVAHFDLDRDWRADKVRQALNYHMKPHPVVVLRSEIAGPEFEARFSATRRHYLYRILNRRSPPVLDRGRVWHVSARLDEHAMGHAAEALIGDHDFNAFRSSHCQAPSSRKTLERLVVDRQGDEIRIRAASRSFLHNQVRIMVGTLKLVGEGRWSRAQVERALAVAERIAAGPTAPAHGLYFARVDYD